MATLTGTLVSDLDPGGSLVAPPRRDPGIRGHAVHFQQHLYHRFCRFGCGRSTTTGRSSALRHRLGALGLLGWRRKRKAQAAADLDFRKTRRAAVFLFGRSMSAIGTKQT